MSDGHEYSEDDERVTELEEKLVALINAAFANGITRAEVLGAIDDAEAFITQKEN